MINSYSVYGNLIQIDYTHNLTHFNIPLFTISTIDSQN